MTNQKEKSNSLTYGSYLKLDSLLNLQEGQATPPAHDELLFIITHQAYELWFKQIIFEITAAVRAVDEDNLLRAQKLLNRIKEILKLLVHQIDIMETMTPVEFNQFRERLNPASGFQSVQFRQLEMLGGLDPETYSRLLALEPEWSRILKAKEPNLRASFFGLLHRLGFTSQSKERPWQDALAEIYENVRHQEVQHLCEDLIHFDELFHLWRFRHVQMVERMIGMKRGTGGSLGVSYLRKTLEFRFFPELWAARTAFGDY